MPGKLPRAERYFMLLPHHTNTDDHYSCGLNGFPEIRLLVSCYIMIIMIIVCEVNVTRSNWSLKVIVVLVALNRQCCCFCGSTSQRYLYIYIVQQLPND